MSESRIGRAILTVSAGNGGQKRQERALGFLEEYLRRRFAPVRIYRSFSDRRTVREYRRNGLPADTVQEALERIRTDGYLRVAVQPALITGGEEYETIMEEIRTRVGYGCFTSIACGKPLLAEREDCASCARALTAALSGCGEERTGFGETDSGEKKSGGRIILLPGRRAGPKAMDLYRTLRAELRDRGSENLYPVAENDKVGMEEFLSGLPEAGGNIFLQPFSFEADGEEEGIFSGKNRPGSSFPWKPGFEVEHSLAGLGEYDEICRLFGDRLEELLPEIRVE